MTGSPHEGHQLQTLTFDQISGPLPLFSTEGMQNSLGGLAMLGVPEAGTMVQDGYKVSMCLFQLVLQGWGKEGMIAIPLALAIQCHYKEIGMLQAFQHILASTLFHHGIT